MERHSYMYGSEDSERRLARLGRHSKFTSSDKMLSLSFAPLTNHSHPLVSLPDSLKPLEDRKSVACSHIGKKWH